MFFQDVKIILLSSLFLIGDTRVNEIWLYTPNSRAKWPVPESQKSVIFAKHLQPYGLDISRLRYVTFHVQACKDAFVYLSESYIMDPNKKHYQCVIGAAGGRNIIPRRAPKIRNFTPPNPLSIQLSAPTKCDSLKMFRISWGGGNITIEEIVNAETKASSTLIDREPFPIRALGVAKHYGTFAKWKFYVKATGHFCSKPNTKGNMDQLFTMSNVTKSYQCALACEKIQACMGFNYKESEFICQLIQTGKPEVTSNVQGWTYFTKCFNGVCLACF